MIQMTASGRLLLPRRHRTLKLHLKSGVRLLLLGAKPVCHDQCVRFENLSAGSILELPLPMTCRHLKAETHPPIYTYGTNVLHKTTDHKRELRDQTLSSVYTAKPLNEGTSGVQPRHRAPPEHWAP